MHDHHSWYVIFNNHTGCSSIGEAKTLVLLLLDTSFSPYTITYTQQDVMCNTRLNNVLDYEECLKKFDVDIHGVRILFQCAHTTSSLSLADYSISCLLK